MLVLYTRWYSEQDDLALRREVSKLSIFVNYIYALFYNYAWSLGSLRWTGIPSRESRNTPSRFMLPSGLMGHLPRMPT